MCLKDLCDEFLYYVTVRHRDATGMRCNEMILMEPEDIKPDYILVKQ